MTFPAIAHVNLAQLRTLVIFLPDVHQRPSENGFGSLVRKLSCGALLVHVLQNRSWIGLTMIIDLQHGDNGTNLANIRIENRNKKREMMGNLEKIRAYRKRGKCYRYPIFINLSCIIFHNGSQPYLASFLRLASFHSEAPSLRTESGIGKERSAPLQLGAVEHKETMRFAKLEPSEVRVIDNKVKPILSKAFWSYKSIQNRPKYIT